MISQLNGWRKRKHILEASGDVFSQHYMWVVSEIESLEREVGDWTEAIGDSEDNYVELPMDICTAARDNDIQKVLNWLGPLPVDKERVNARNPEAMELTLVFYAVSCKNSNLLSILLQLGADVDPVNAIGTTPLSLFGYEPEYMHSRGCC